MIIIIINRYEMTKLLHMLTLSSLVKCSTTVTSYVDSVLISEMHQLAICNVRSITWRNFSNSLM